MSTNNDIYVTEWYRRFKVRDTEMYRERNAHFNTLGGLFEGLFHGAVLEGFDFQGATGLTIGINPGYAVGPTGYFMSQTPVNTVLLPTPTASQAVRHLIVARPNLIPGNYITRPTVPFDSVPLTTDFTCQIVAVTGISGASGEYPSASLQVNDVVLFGVHLKGGDATVTSDNIDMEVRYNPGKSSAIFQRIQGADDRCRPYRSTNRLLGIKPSQLLGARPRGFVYVSKTKAALYPLSGGVFNNADSFYNFQSGAVTGGDAATPAFTPTIPTAGNFIVATVGLDTNNLINITYGTQGTLAQCITGITNQSTAGAGSISTPNSIYKIAYVIVGSIDGAIVSSLDVIDARSGFVFGGPDSSKNLPTVFLSPAGNGDVTTFASAISTLAGSPGSIFVMDSCSVFDSISVLPAYTKLFARDRNVTLTFNGASGIRAAGYCDIEQITLAASGGIPILSLEGDHCRVLNSVFDGPSGLSTFIGCRVAGNHATIKDSIFKGCVDPASGIGIQPELGYSDLIESGNTFTT